MPAFMACGSPVAARAAPFGQHVADGVDDGLVAGAAAIVTRDPEPRPARGWRPAASHQFRARHQHARRAVAALQRVAVEEGLLQVAHCARLGQAFDGLDRLAVGLHRQHQAAAHDGAVQRTVQAPQTPCSQPRCEPVRSSSSRRKSTRCWRGLDAALTRWPLTVKAMPTSVLMRHAPVVAPRAC